MDGRREHGFTLVELMVGLAIGLVIAGAATASVLGHVREWRTSWIESRLLQELRDAADVVARDLRRAGHWRDATMPAWSGTSDVVNPHAAFLPAAAASDGARLSYSRESGPQADEQIGFRLRDGVIEMLLGSGRWQALTDAGTVVVTAFDLTPVLQQVPLQGVCARACAAPATCAPMQAVRSVTVAIRGHAAGDVRLVRNAESLARLRNDVVTGACPS